ncbi:MAG: 3-dehydroquinate synthase [Thermoleophilia bacterium]
MIQLLASTPSKEYPVYLSAAAVREAGNLWSSRGRPGKVGIITDSNVANLFLGSVEQVFVEAGFAVKAIVVDAGEEAKSLAEATRIFSELFRLQTRRCDAVCALGGGVVGDLAGFVASTYMRGIGFVQIPTTLLSQVDSSIGGKVGININEAKNYVGCFYQPDMVITDPELLKTLPRDQVVEGLAEVVKYALLSGDKFFYALESGYKEFLMLNMAFVEPMVRRCIEYKLGVVSEDERDYGRRAVLNLGHSVGHGIETAGNYTTYSHGQAVALGLLAAVRISEQVFSFPGDYSQRLEVLLGLLGLPTHYQGIDPGAVISAMSSDKKADDISANMVLLKTIGEPVINCDVDATMLRREVERLAAGGK